MQKNLSADKQSKTLTDPATYDAWYKTPRGHWISDQEFSLLTDLLKPQPGAQLLDVGCGTGHFSRRFAASGLVVTGIDPDAEAIGYARQQNQQIQYLQGSALALPFADDHFDYSAAVTSLCFIDEPALALKEMWRVTRHKMVLGLLNHHSLLYLQKRHAKSYHGARWDKANTIVKTWLPYLDPAPRRTSIRSAVFMPQGNRFARLLEKSLPNRLPWGGFLAICIEK